jgi:hypothetical protein
MSKLTPEKMEEIRAWKDDVLMYGPCVALGTHGEIIDGACSRIELLLDRIAELDKALGQAVEAGDFRLETGNAGETMICSSLRFTGIKTRPELTAVLRARKEGEKNVH